MFDVYHAATRYLPSDWRRRVYAYLNDANIETALKTITKQYASRPGQHEQFAKQDISTRGNKRAEISGPDGSGQWRAYVIQKSPTGLPSEPYHEDLLGDMKFFDTEEKARRAASKMLASRPGQPERFDMEGACWEGYEPVGTKQKDGKTVPNCVPMKNAAGGQEKFSGVDTIAAYVQVLYEEFGTARGKQAAQEMMRAAQSIGGNAGAALQKAIRTASTSKNVSERNRAIGDIEDYLMREGFSRPGQPERFAIPSNAADIKIKDIQGANASELDQLEKMLRPAASAGDAKAKRYIQMIKQERQWLREGMSGHPRWSDRMSRPGQPEKFDASSLDRGSFAEASQSPMLGKLLAAKVMPEGGWRAVQAGSDTLVISFEDADLARDFGRRVATKGYNATSPVQAIGRYWNVEVKNG